MPFMKNLMARIGLLCLLLLTALPGHAREMDGFYQAVVLAQVDTSVTSDRRVPQLPATGMVAVIVTNVTTLVAYARVMQYLQSLDLVTNVQVARVQGGAVLFNLNVRGDVNGIDRAIALGGILRRTVTEDNQMLVYQLLP